MNLQQLRYLVTTADEGTMTRAAEALHVAQPALSRAVRSLEGEIGVTVFERKGRGVKVTRQGHDVIAVARRILAEVDRLVSLGQHEVLRVCAITGQAREIGSPTIAGFVTGGHGRAALDVVDTAKAVVDEVRDGRAILGIIDLPAPPDLWVTSLGWQEMVLVHPPDWVLDDPLDISALSDLPLLSPGSDNWRHAALETNLRSMGVDPIITAETTERDLLTGLVVQGAGAWFSYGRQADAAVAGGAGLVHLTPPAVREIGIVSSGEPGEAARTFIEIARAETATSLLPIGDPTLEHATWFSGADILGTSAPPTSVRPPRRDR
jgi:LysR family cyn operon transcriptional activator